MLTTVEINLWTLIHVVKYLKSFKDVTNREYSSKSGENGAHVTSVLERTCTWSHFLFRHGVGWGGPNRSCRLPSCVLPNQQLADVAHCTPDGVLQRQPWQKGTGSTHNKAGACFKHSSTSTGNPIGLLKDTQNYGLRMRRECRERFPRHHRSTIPTCITARLWRTCRDACRDR